MRRSLVHLKRKRKKKKKTQKKEEEEEEYKREMIQRDEKLTRPEEGPSRQGNRRHSRQDSCVFFFL